MARRTGVLAALGALLSGCSAVDALNAATPQGSYRGTEDVAYGPDARHRLDIYQPTDGAPAHPVVLFFYGGNWSEGSRRDYRFVGEALAARGVLAVIADYRLSPQVRWDGILQDCALAAHWVQGNAARLGGDGRLFLMGHSAGAYNAAMLALDARWLGTHGLSPAALAGWIGIAGPYDFLPIGNPVTRVAFNWPNTPADSQPLVHASARAPRTLLLAAEKDSLVDPQRNTQGLARRLEAAGVPVRVRVFDRVNHATVIGAMARPLRFLAPVVDEVSTFILQPQARG